MLPGADRGIRSVATTLLLAAFLVAISVLADTPAANAAPPLNDNLSAAAALPFPAQTNPVAVAEATTELGEPAPACTGSGARTIWYKSQHTQSVTATVDTAISDYDTVLAVYSGPPNATSFASLAPVGCNNDFQGTVSRVTFPMIGGTWYYFQIAQFGAFPGSTALRLGVIPPNDDFAGAIPLPTPQVPGIVAEASTFMASTEAGETMPTCASGTPLVSLWYSWTSPNTPGHAVFDTYGSSYDTVLAIYTGGGFPLVENWCSNNWVGDASLGLVNYNAATTYYIQVTKLCPDLPCVINSGGQLILNMSMGSTVFVTSTADTNTPDSDLTLREAIHLSQGTLGRAPQIGEDPLSTNYGINAGAAAGDLIHTYFPCSGFGCLPGYRTVNLGSPLPTLATGNDVLRRTGLGVRVNGQDLNFTCLDLTGNNNHIEGFTFHDCDGDSFPAGVRASGSGNVIGGSLAGSGNEFFSNGVGVALIPSGTGNKLNGNMFGQLAANDLGIAVTGANNFIGGSAPGEGNTFVAATFEQIRVFGVGATGNTIRGNQIGGSTISQGQAVRIDTSANNNSVGGSNPGEGNVISGASIGVLIQSGSANSIIGNKIGTDSTGAVGRPNHTGVLIESPTSNAVVGGNSAGARNVIASSTNEGIVVRNLGGATIKGNYIGTNAAGTAALPNAVGIGVYDSAGALIGGGAAGEGNLISGNTLGGVWIDNSGGNNATGHTLQGNFIGTDAAGVGAIANGSHGVQIENSDLNQVGGAAAGQGNRIAFNAGDGVYVGTGAIGNTVRGNAIHSNTGLGINNASGGNGEPTHAPPAVTASGSASGTACANCTVDVYSDTANEGRVYHGSAVANDAGAWNFPGAVVGPNVTATATRADGSTSEFSAPFACPDGDGDAVCNSGDNCPVLANANQLNQDGDPQGDLCDNCPNWTNPTQTLPNWTVPANDPDCDGWNDTRELHVGTDPTNHCNATSTVNDEADAWPTDFNDSRFTTLADVSSFNPTYNKFEGDLGYSQRHDLNASDGVTLADVSLVNPFYNKTCG